MVYIVLSFDIGVKNLAYCLFEYHSHLHFKIIEWDVLNIQTIAKKNVIDLQSDILFNCLHDTFSNKKIDYILIENQPVLKNPVMKSIQIMVYSYFKILQRQTDYIVKVLLINAQNKIKFATNTLCNVLPDIDKTKCVSNSSNKYKIAKDLSIAYTKELLRCLDMDDKLLFFEKFKKKDDLADTLLQGLYFTCTTFQ